ncbi:FAD-dependent oxidoreductase [Lentibacillus cibarius]|uniref:FAD-dependent oxidoreductase n=1 Tax=Lentibacillus cibarius TaxID=2583219 RepID=A0A5S3QN39_9BACI|nr:FAD-dependent oxidoreductase [Lentibacillus cibarius]TMN23199.1 FAD-dependent oxidoreductase [Lentibacillus cibarius]
MTEYDDKGLPQESKSYWLEGVDLPAFPSLEENRKVDVAIVGGGIAGITSAYLLTEKGYKVALLDSDTLLHGTTGHTTAKVTAQHGLIYDELIQNIGEKKAKKYYRANLEALQFIQNMVEQQEIDCDFRKQDAYLYATSDEDIHKLKKEAKAYDRLGIDGELIDSLPLTDIKVKKALVMKNQAQFHPTKYLSKLVQKMHAKGAYIYENTTAVNINSDKETKVMTRNGKEIKADKVLVCSHFPFYEGTGLYSARMHASRSYILAAKTKKKFPGGMYISVGQPTRSLRSVEINGENMVLIVGESHKTGQGEDTMKHYQALEDFGQKTFGLDQVVYRWSAQDLITLDKVPFIGKITANQPHTLIATGFRKWGMSNGTAAALLLTDLVTGDGNTYADLFTPLRFNAKPGLKNILVDNANVVGQLVKGKIELPDDKLKNLSIDEGAVIMIKGERKGAYKDKQGNVYVVDTTCTHVGCEVGWNGAERSWDCPCHGSRFSYTGEVIEGPAETPLKRYDYHMLDNLTSKDSGY